MPTARESLLDAASRAIAVRPWSRVRMVEVAVAAKVSRQTLYHEFGDKEGLARALLRREADVFLAGVERVLTAPGGPDPAERLVALAGWTVRTARGSPLLRAMLTGCWSEWLPRPAWPDDTLRRGRSSTGRRADVPPPSPAELLGEVRERAVAVLAGGRHGPLTEELRRDGEAVLRLALSCVLVPGGAEERALLLRGCRADRAGPRGAPGARADGADRR
ncbi:TetR/AcrR family transcriptional regulator [Streptomyces sp. TP-A0874]|uniref:TetR/AcrR family transcriptional regulator n=1 Tax=Streptomyces sp. TP-A0874 TaxID=549819 RepID=UPI000852B293|nr:TetR/AcrR family transcriptional regulator [Streptomyces sp. TP-A0874]